LLCQVELLLEGHLHEPSSADRRDFTTSLQQKRTHRSLGPRRTGIRLFATQLSIVRVDTLQSLASSLRVRRGSGRPSCSALFSLWLSIGDATLCVPCR
jgi:hypothetical protein